MANNDGSLSYHLYEQLMEFVGTPNIVRIRRQFFKSMNKILSCKLHSAICSGSKAEGLNMTGSDLDVMIINNEEIVNNDIPSKISARTFRLYLDLEHTTPGFARIGIKVDSNENLPRGSARTENGYVLDNRHYRGNSTFRHSKDSYFNYFSERYMDMAYPTHGPCVSSLDETYDFLMGFQCKSWPYIANNWFERAREWPSTNLMENILNEKVVLAPIGSKFGSALDNPNEWRLSFSVAEIMLIHSFNHTQLTCYAMLKIMLKEVIDTNRATEKLLCSYFIKTILFWVIEETGYSAWQPSTLIQCFRMCLKRLLYLVENGQCPNYFIPQNNMFEGKIFGNSQKELCNFLESLYSEGINAFRRSKTLNKYLQIVYEAGTPSYVDNVSVTTKDVDQAIYPLLHHVHKLVAIGFPLGPDIHKAFCQVMNEKQSKLAKSFQVLNFINICQHAGQECEYDMTNRNKHLYSKFRHILCLLVIGTYSDAGNGWLMLALFFYHHQQYNYVLMITDLVLSSYLTKECQIISDRSVPKSLVNVSNFRSSFLKRYRYTCFKINMMFIKEKRFFRNTDLQIAFPPHLPPSIAQSTPAVFANFLKFMCFHHNGQTDKRERTLLCLQRQAEDFNPGPKSYEFIVDMIYLERAFSIANRRLPIYLEQKYFEFFSKQLSDPSVRNLIEKNAELLFQ